MSLAPTHLPPPPSPTAVLSPLGMVTPRVRRHGAVVWKVLGVVFAAVVLAVLALVLIAVLASETGVTGFLLGSMLALVPVVPVVAAYLYVDRYEPEPVGVLVYAFLWGAIVASLVAAFINTASMVAISQAHGAEGMSTTAVYVAPFVEEGAKGLGILLVLLVRRKEFDGVVDGIVLAGLIGIGFAMSENVLYYGQAYLTGSQNGAGVGFLSLGFTFVLRGVLSPFAHPLFTTMTGIGLGVAATTRRPVLKLAAPLLGYAGAVLLHGSWNASAQRGLHGFVSGYFLLMLPVFLAVVAVTFAVRAREGRLIARELRGYVAAGWLPDGDAAMVASLAARRRARAWAQRTAGDAGARAMSGYQRTATELAFLRERATRGVGHRDFTDDERELLVELAQQRAVFAGRAAYAPG